MVVIYLYGICIKCNKYNLFIICVRVIILTESDLHSIVQFTSMLNLCLNDILYQIYSLIIYYTYNIELQTTEREENCLSSILFLQRHIKW